MQIEQLCVAGKKIYLRNIGSEDVDDFYKLLASPRVTSMLRRLPEPWDRRQAEKWIDRRVFHGRPGFVLKIVGKELEYLGFIGISGVSNSLMFALTPQAEGHGIASDALETFTDFVFSNFSFDAVRASTAIENIRSANMLRRMGFEIAGQEKYTRYPGASPETLNTFELKRTTGGTG